MMSVVEFLSQPLWQRFGLSLLHFLWQGLVVAVLVGVIVRVFRPRHGNARYATYLLAFVIMIAFPLITLTVIDVSTDPDIGPGTGLESPAAINSTSYTVLPAGDVLPEATASRSSILEPAALTESLLLRERISEWLNVSMPWVLMTWMFGVLVLSARLLMGFVGVHRWRRHLEPLPEGLALRIASLSDRLGMHRFSRIFVSANVLQAMAAGYLRPMVLLPGAMLTQMQPEMIEAVIAHELAHIRRFDLWINLLQRVAETLLFYHPAIWWLSNHIRSERELCCDELAVQATGQRLTYVTTLESVGREGFMATPVLAAGLGQDNQPTLSRVRHILGLTPVQRNCPFWLAGVIAVLLLVALTIPTALALTNQSDEKPADLESAVLEGIRANRTALPKDIFKGSIKKQLKAQEMLQKYLAEGLSDIKEAATADKVKRGAREAIEMFIAAALEGDFEKAREFADPDKAPARQIADISEITKGQDLWTMAVVADDFSAMAISSAIHGDHERLGPLVFYLDREPQDGRDNWWVHDIDLETPDRAELKLKQFLEEHAKARKISPLKDLEQVSVSAGGSETMSSDSRSFPAEEGDSISNADTVRGSLQAVDLDPLRVQIDLMIAESVVGAKTDWETYVSIKNLMDGKVTPGEQPDSVDSVLEKRSDMGEDKLETLIDLLVSRAYVKTIFNPLLEVYSGQAARIATKDEKPSDENENIAQESSVSVTLSITPEVQKDKETIQLHIDLDLNIAGKEIKTVSKYTVSNEKYSVFPLAGTIMPTEREQPAESVLLIVKATILDDTSDKKKPAEQIGATRIHGVEGRAVDVAGSPIAGAAGQEKAGAEPVVKPSSPPINGEGPKDRTVLGLVVDPNGQALPQIPIMTYGYHERDTVTGHDGRFAFKLPFHYHHEAGCLIVARDRGRNLAAFHGYVGQTNRILMKLEPAVVLAGSICDSQGNGIPNARLMLYWRFPDGRVSYGEREFVAIDENGQFEIQAIPYGRRYSLDVDAQGYGCARTGYIDTYERDARIQLPPLVLQTADQSVGGIVVDPNGNPVFDAEVRSAGEGQAWCQSRSNKQGRFLIKGICPGAVKLHGKQTQAPISISGDVEAQAGDMNARIVLNKRRRLQASVSVVNFESLMGKTLPSVTDLGITEEQIDTADKQILVCYFDMQKRWSRQCVIQLAKQAERLQQKGIADVVIQALDVERNKLDEWIKLYHISFPIAIAQGFEDKIRSAWGVKSLPWLVLTDKDHMVTHEGLTLQELVEELK